MGVTLLAKQRVQNSFKPIMCRLAKEFAQQNHLPEDEEVFVEAKSEEVQGKTYIVTFIYLGEYMEDPYMSPIGAVVYIGALGGLSYKTKNGLLKERSSLSEVVRLACKFYKGNIMPCKITIDVGLPKGNNLKADERIRKLLLDLGATDPKVTIQYDIKED